MLNLDSAEFNRSFLVYALDVKEAEGNPNKQQMLTRMMEMGFIEGATVCKRYAAPFSNDPIAVEVEGHLVALRRNEAKMIHVVIEDAGVSE
jgi:ferrous iron transport protein A